MNKNCAVSVPSRYTHVHTGAKPGGPAKETKSALHADALLVYTDSARHADTAERSWRRERTRIQVDPAPVAILRRPGLQALLGRFR